MAGDDCPSLLVCERSELFELQWRDGYPVEEPILDHADDHGGGAGGSTSSPDEWWKLWREGEGGGALPGFTQGVGLEESYAAQEKTKEQYWRLWREGVGTSTQGYPPQDSSHTNSAPKVGDEPVLPSWSAASGDSSGALMHSSEQVDEQCSTLDHAIEYMKSLQQQIQVLSSSRYCVQPQMFPCICTPLPPHAAVVTATAAAAPPPHPAAAADLNTTVAVRGLPPTPGPISFDAGAGSGEMGHCMS